MLKFSAPSKTFIIGEYLALSGGTTLIANTEPRFELTVKTNANGECRGIHPQSPAGQWVRQNHIFFNNIDLEFIDPHQGQGGFGASSAQFIFVYLLTQLIQNNLIQFEEVNTKKVWEAFRHITSESESSSPSGADVIGQLLGGLSYFKRQPFVSDRLNWSFNDLSFALLRTGQKLATHDHLKNLGELPVKDLEDIASASLAAVRSQNSNAFVQTINGYQDVLTKVGLTHENSLQLLSQLKSNEHIVAAKGCGAAGVDVLLVCFAKEHARSVVETIKQLNLKVVADETLLSEASKLEFSLEPFSSSKIFELQSIGDMV